MPIVISQQDTCQQEIISKCEIGETSLLPRCSLNLPPVEFYVLNHIVAEVTRYFRSNKKNPLFIKASKISLAKRLGVGSRAVKSALTNLENASWLGVKGKKIYPNYLSWEDLQKIQVVGQRKGVLKIPIALIEQFKGKPTYFKVLVSRISNTIEFNASLSTGKEARLFGISRKHLNDINKASVDLGHIKQIKKRYKNKFYLNSIEVNRYQLSLMARGIIVTRHIDAPEMHWDSVYSSEDEYQYIAREGTYYDETVSRGYSKTVSRGVIQGIPLEQQVITRNDSSTGATKCEKIPLVDNNLIQENIQNNKNENSDVVELKTTKNNKQKIKHCFPPHDNILDVTHYRRLCAALRYLMPVGTTWKPVTDKFKQMFVRHKIDHDWALSWIEKQHDRLGDFPMRYRDSKCRGLICDLMQDFILYRGNYDCYLKEKTRGQN